ncbi:MAG: hypothetical protein ACI9F9_003007 [Candidatus Paceibacteria bacterium]|jgi:hypothetical protein
MTSAIGKVPAIRALALATLVASLSGCGTVGTKLFYDMVARGREADAWLLLRRARRSEAGARPVEEGSAWRAGMDFGAACLHGALHGRRCSLVSSGGYGHSSLRVPLSDL